jgi:ABC-type dipeptide/oligopeptide/nickel transport system ATPase subunit
METTTQWQAYLEQGDMNVRDQLLNEHLGLVHHVARQLSRSLSVDADFDELVAKLRDTLGLTVYMVTHDLDSLFSVCDRVAVLGRKKVMVEGTIPDLMRVEEPWVKSYFRGKRARQLDLAVRREV